MSSLPPDLLEELRAYAHYRDADYDALEARLGTELLNKRLEKQIGVYRKLMRWQKNPAMRYFHPVFRFVIRAGLWSLGQYGKAKQSARSPEGVEHEVYFQNLPPAFDGFRVLQLTDFHFDFIPEMPAILEKALEGKVFDLCVLTGDYRGEIHGPYEESLQHLRSCRPLLGNEVYAVLGNHDNVEILLGLPNMQIQPLVNESVWIERGGERILLAGIDDAHMYQTHDFAPLEANLKASPFTLLLSHSPESYAEAEAAGVDYMLCGHTHGGQLCLPGGYPLIAHIGDSPKKVIKGEWTHGRLKAYTSRGIGISSVDCRLNCPPEITVHVLRKNY
jgi:predicted MPP superfamily phosphohydrolase